MPLPRLSRHFFQFLTCKTVYILYISRDWLLLDFCSNNVNLLITFPKLTQDPLLELINVLLRNFDSHSITATAYF